MTETLNNLIQRIATDLKNALLGYEMLRGYLECDCPDVTTATYESQNALFIKYERFQEIKRMLINLNVRGSVRERADGLLELRIWIDGKRISVYGRSEEELRQKFQALRRRRKKRIKAPQPQNVSEKQKDDTTTLYAWLDKWVELYKEDKVKPNSLSAIKSCIKNHVHEQFMDISLKSLEPLQIEENLKKIESTRMRKYTYQILNEAFRRAKQLKLIKENPFELVDVPQHREQKGTPLLSEEQVKFRADIENSPYRYYYLFLLGSGCRRGEGLSARWEDIDFQKKRIFIRGTKTEKSRDYIPLFEELEEMLLKIMPEKPQGLIFPFPIHQVEREFKRLCPAHHLHDLRHTFATNCIEAGVELKAVQAWLRHSNIRLTADTYAHATDKFLMQEAEKLKKKQ